MRRRNEEYAEATRQAIVAAGRHAFGKQGFTAASLDEIAAAAQVTTGAIYHHFNGKVGLFEQVACQVEEYILEAVLAASRSKREPWQQFTAAIASFLDMASNPAIQQIVFRDAPTFIGVAKWREIEGRYAYGLLIQSLKAFAAGGLLKPIVPELVAPMLLGALIEAATAVAMADDKIVARAGAETALNALISGLLA